MNSFQRKVIACVVSTILNQSESLCLFDHDTEENICLSITFNAEGFYLIKDSDVIVSVEKKPLKWIILVRASKRIIELKQFATHFSGYDYQSKSYFTLREEDNALKLYDNDTDDFHYFSLEKQLL